LFPYSGLKHFGPLRARGRVCSGGYSGDICQTIFQTPESMRDITSKEDQEERSKNRFARHPVITIGVLLTVVLLICLGGAELFLRTFSGLGNPPLYDLSPLYGYRLKANQVIEPKGGIGFLYGARVTTNNLGLRAAGEWDDDPSGKVLFLGDSVTYGGQYVSDAQLFSSLAGARLKGWQTGNGGVNAWGIGNLLGLVRGYEFTPAEVVVTCVIEGDFYRGTTRASSLPLWVEKPKFALEDLLMHLVWRVNELRYGSSVYARVRDSKHLDRIVNRGARRLRDLDHYLKSRQMKHFIFILPSRSQVVGGESEDPRVARALQKYGVRADYLLPKLLDLEPDRKKRRKWFHDEVHLEPPGHRVYGTLIGDALAKELQER